ncbi:MAG: S8 family serine peptidase [Bacilli bacterium]|nr:S8 family serine peptidase [Bacilli bacterium]
MKKCLFTGLMAAVTLFGTVVSVSLKDEEKFVPSSESTEVKAIVEVAENLEGLNEEEIYASQNKVINSIKNKVTKDFDLVDRYHVLNNAFVIKVNSDAVKEIKKLNGVKDVNIDKMHYKTSSDQNITLSTIGINGSSTQEIISKADQDQGAEEENISATTMNKPSGTNEGEGTIIAVLDNEFYIKGKTATEEAYSHVAYKPLPAGTIERMTYDSMKAIVRRTHAGRNFNSKKAPGEEGSLYFNSKVPFYYDYGGNIESYGADGKPDCDVISTVSYHGSHVSSIIGANANEYKGLAPKCQLVCMKVFTEYKVDETGKGLGLSSYSGGTETAILSALEDAITLGCDGINMSLGSDLDDFDQDTIYLRTIAKLATTSGMMTAIAAGNGGKGAYSFTGGYGNWTTDTVETGVLGSYANSTEATVVASAQPNEVYFEHAVSSDDGNGQVTNIAYEDQIVNREGYDNDYPENLQCYIKDCADPITGKVGWVYIPNFGTSGDFKGKDVNGKIAIVNRGSTSFAEKYALAVQNKAKGLIIINNDPTSNEFNFRCSFGDGFSPSIPCALVLYKDKPYLEEKGEGEFVFIEKQASINGNAKTVSTFTNDGARFNYDLKPDVATPGDSIRGAIPPQKTEDKENTSISTYEYMSGTSMATPNFAGAQALLLGEKAKDTFAEGIEISADAMTKFVDYRKSIDMRLMSTAHKMMDSKANPETNTISPTSPRIQGAGLVDLGGALKTKVYLNGIDVEGKEINKSKIQLRNTADIAKGDLNMKFNAYNDDSTAKSYKVKLTVMRPALESNNKVIQDKYNYTGEIDDISKMSGYTYWKKQFVVGQGDVAKQFTSEGHANQYDVVKLTKQIEYYSSKIDCENEVNKKTIAPGYYYNASATGHDWQPLPDYTYQSIKDVVIYEGETGQTVTVNPGKNTITINKWSIPQAEKAKIAAAYDYGCAIEGYVELISTADEPDLSIPFLGFYSMSDMDETKSLRDAPVVEPFEFDKKEGISYPSDLVNDITNALLGKTHSDMGSLWVTGYAENPNDIDTSKILSNDTSFTNLTGFHSVGKDPKTGSYYDSASDCIYVGSPETTNTMIIQQFVMRSVNDNYFEIKNSAGETVYKSVLEDMLFREQHGKYPLYKSHVDSNYLGAGYVAHRAYAVIPLFDVMTNEAFKDGEYTITFNYELAYDKSWVSSSYKFVVDATLPSIDNIKTYNDAGEDRVRINLKDYKVSSAVIGYANADVNYDSETNQYYLDVSKEFVLESMDTLGDTLLGDYRPRLYVEVTDAAYGVNKMVIHFTDENLSQYEIVEGSHLDVSYDYKYEDGALSWVSIDYEGLETEMAQPVGSTFKDNYRTPQPEASKGCGGSIAASSSLILILVSLGLALTVSKKKQLFGGKK